MKILSMGSKVDAMNTGVRLRGNGNLREKNITITSFRITKMESDKYLMIMGYKRLIHPYIF